MDVCECCHKTAGEWYVVDDNAEVILCRKCAKEFRGIGEKVEKMI